MKITVTDKENGSIKDVERVKHEHSPYEDSGTTWGRPQGGKTAGTRQGPATAESNVTKSSPTSAATGAKEAMTGGVVQGVVQTATGLIG